MRISLIAEFNSINQNFTFHNIIAYVTLSSEISDFYVFNFYWSLKLHNNEKQKYCHDNPFYTHLHRDVDQNLFFGFETLHMTNSTLLKINPRIHGKAIGSKVAGYFPFL